MVATGKRVWGALYLHRSAIPELDDATRHRLSQCPAPTDARWNVLRVADDHLGFLDYEDFAVEPFPALLQSWRVGLDGGLSQRDFRASADPFILHRKELLVSPGYPGRNLWVTLTTELEALGLYKRPHQIGRRRPWNTRLSDAGITIRDHVIVR